MNDPQERWSAVLSLKLRYLGFALAVAVLMSLLILTKINLSAQQATETAEATEMAGASVAEIVAAANTFLDSLDETQREAVLFDFNDEAQRENWSNLPTQLFNRAGLSYTSLTEELAGCRHDTASGNPE